MLFFFFGEDEYRIAEKVTLFRDRFAVKDPSGLNFLEYTKDSFSFFGLKEALTTPAFLAKQRFCILQDCFSYSREDQEAILELLSLKTPHVLLITHKGKPDKRVRLFGALQKQATCQEFSLLAGNRLHHWVIEQFGQQGITCSADCAEHLSFLVGSNLRQLTLEIDKLCAYTQQAHISRDDIDRLVVGDYSSSVFEALEALLSRNRSRTLSLFHEQIAQGHHSLYFFSMLVSQFRQLLILSDLIGRQGVSGLASASGLHPFVVKKLQPYAQRYPYTLISSLYQKLAAMDESLKTGQVDPLLALDMFLVGFTKES